MNASKSRKMEPSASPTNNETQPVESDARPRLALDQRTQLDPCDESTLTESDEALSPYLVPTLVSIANEGASLIPARRPRDQERKPPQSLTVEQILEWADAHRAATGHWPFEGSGAVAVEPLESWRAISHALSKGRRGLPGGSSLAKLLADHRGGSQLEDQPADRAEALRAWEEENFPVRGPRLRLKGRGPRPPLFIGKILAWADAHHARTGDWPRVMSGVVVDAPYDETWSAINAALYSGWRGLPMGSSLGKLLAEHRGARYEPAIPRLTQEQILEWADAHFAATGAWPVQTSGALQNTRRDTWKALSDALRVGRRGLPGGTTLARLLADKRGARNMHSWGKLDVRQILAWADAHRAATHKWPTFRCGPVLGAPGEAWHAIDSSLYQGWRGMPGGSSLAKLLAEHRGVEPEKRHPDLTVPQILAWADSHREKTGRWPSENSGRIIDATDESWQAITAALAKGSRGLPGGSSLARLLAEHRDARNPRGLPRLSLPRILAWADAHFAATGRWPSSNMKEVSGAPGERWSAINQALFKGMRGLSGGTSLAQLLSAHRQVERRILPLDRIRTWAELHLKATGAWPNACSGRVIGEPEESWSAIDGALRHGYRGLPGGTPLCKLFGRTLNPDARGIRPALTYEQIRAWADAFRAVHGRWPNRKSGPIPGAPGEKWVNIDAALHYGRRGLPAGSRLRLLTSQWECTTGT
jgi:hypothetical protein